MKIQVLSATAVSAILLAALTACNVAKPPAAISKDDRIHRHRSPYLATFTRRARSCARISGAYIASTDVPGRMNSPALTTRTA